MPSSPQRKNSGENIHTGMHPNNKTSEFNSQGYRGWEGAECKLHQGCLASDLK